VGGLVYLVELSGEVAGRGGDGGDAERGSVPDDGVVELGYGDVEAVAEFLFHGADDLAAVLERLGVGDFDLEDEFGQWHGRARIIVANRFPVAAPAGDYARLR
jgi:hypothetical protein